MNRGRHKKGKEKEFNTQDDFICKVKVALDEATIKNSIYTIKFEFGHNTKIFKYKHE